MPSLDQIPSDILYQIAHFVVLDCPHGPPETIFCSLFLVSKAIHSATSVHLKALAFRAQFDTEAICRRLPMQSTPTRLASELERRWLTLKRIRWAGSDITVWGTDYTSEQIRNDLWLAFFLLLEDDGKNWRQLVRWARLRVYIRVFFKYDLIPACANGELPQETEERSLAMWLLWLLTNAHDPDAEVDHDANIKRILPALAFSSFAYATELYPWYIFRTESDIRSSLLNHQVSQPRALTPHPQYNRVSSISSYLMEPICISTPLLSQAALHLFFDHNAPPPGSANPMTASATVHQDATHSGSRRYDDEWRKLTTMWNPISVQDMPQPGYWYVEGSLSGTYEGKFVLPEIGVSQRLAEGAPPIATLDEGWMFSHYQTWKIDEYIFHPQSGVSGSDSHLSRALDPGPALNAHLPENIVIGRVSDGIAVYSPQAGTSHYKKWTGNTNSMDDSQSATPSPVEDMHQGGSQELVDIIVIGESIDYIQAPLRLGNMMPPTSTAVGTIRRRDGVITLVVSSATAGGKWHYIGRLSIDGAWVGRWRIHQENLTGIVYEGLFELRRI